MNSGQFKIGHSSFIKGKVRPWDSPTEFKKGRTPWNKGTTGICKPNSGNFKEGHTPWAKLHPELCKPNSGSFKKGNNTGTKHHNWKGGKSSLSEKIRKSFEYRQWRSDIFHRDDFTCQDCREQIGGSLEVHHIISFASILQKYEIITLEQAIKCEALWDFNNGITLCIDCHNLTKKKAR